MCSEDVDAQDVAIMAICAIGATVESYIQEGYCDPTMYKLVDLVEHLSHHLGSDELTERLTLLKLQAGETVNGLIDKHELPIDKSEWSR